MKLLDLSEAPEDSIRRVMWLSGVHKKVQAELDAAFSQAYYDARMEERLPSAVNAGPHSMKQALKFTRQHNRSSGQMVRWGDGLDPTSRR